MSDDDIQPPDEGKNSLSDMKLLWHGEIEEKLDRANPLLCTMIYDSCRYLESIGIKKCVGIKGEVMLLFILI